MSLIYNILYQMFKIFSILFSNIFKNVLNIRKRKMNLSKNRVSTFPAGQLKRKIVVLNKEVIIIGEEKKFSIKSSI